MVKPSTQLETMKRNAKKLLSQWGKPLLLELLKGIAKGAGLLLLASLAHC
jgi:hypothetical protein